MRLFYRIKQKAKRLKIEIMAISLALKDKRTPLIAKLMIGITISYALSPIDLIPDFIPVLGYLDDLIILPVLIIITIKLIPKEVLIDCRNRVNTEDKLNKKFGIYSAIIIVLIWVSVIGFIIYKIVK